ncbi:hypothetical protein R1sor_006976 [Riccia sorocarpa]|uniref:1-(5-phosphoribosyl)-5-[(5-phosphoribosylamino)methylideneamino] imidazole-4-carboxamide isomerase HISN3, chloroplastic n=1 Tax=Riccia sorocarpa TaxID=122646 RepID=A0ABD3HSS8_9MARC
MAASVISTHGIETLHGCPLLFESRVRPRVQCIQPALLKMRKEELLRSGKQVMVRSAAGDVQSVVQAKDRAVTFRPCIDIHKGKVKQIVGSTLVDAEGVTAEISSEGKNFDDGSSLVTNFVSEQSAAYFAQLYKSHGLKGGHVIALSKDEASEEEARKALNEYPGGLQFGGGVNPDNAQKYIDYGASHVIVTSYVFNQGEFSLENLEKIVSVVGKEKLVLDLSCRKKDGQYFVVTDRWQRFSSCPVNKNTLVDLGKYADEFLVHGVDVEGKRLGVDEELVRLLGEYSPIPVTYAGGVSTMDDLDVIIEAGGGKVHVTVGSGLDIFGGPIRFSDVVSWHHKNTGRENLN